MVDMRQYCDNCPRRDTCSLEQKNVSILIDHYYTRDGRRIEVVKARIEASKVSSTNDDHPNFKQMSFDDIT